MIARDLTVTGPPELEVHAPVADVTLDRGPGGAVGVRIDTKNAEDWSVVQNGDTIVVRDDRGGWRSRGRGRVHITVPDGAAVRITTASGDVTVSVSTGRTAVTTASGDVRVGVASSLTIKTASGDVTVDRVADDAVVKTASGDVSAAAVGGDLDASTASGDVRVDQVGGGVRVSTASGDVRIARFEGHDFVANTVSGDVSVGIPTGRKVDLDVNTLSGDVILPERRTAEPAPAGAPNPALSKVNIRVKSVSGDFRLQRA